MQNLTDKNFGLVIAYLVPGFIAICGASFRSQTIEIWLVGHGGVSVGGFLYSSLAALFIGLICSTVRWLILDHVHQWTGVTRPDWDFSRLRENVGAFSLLIESHYRYYQFYGNCFVAILIAYGCWRPTSLEPLPSSVDIVFLLTAMLLFLGSRDTLQKYYRRVTLLLKSELPSRIITSSLDLAK